MDSQTAACSSVMATISADKDDPDSTEKDHVICSYSGLKLLYFEHCYCRNSASLFQTFVNEDAGSETEVIILDEVKSTSKISKVVTHEVEKLPEAIPTLKSKQTSRIAQTADTVAAPATPGTPVAGVKAPAVPATAAPVLPESPIPSTPVTPAKKDTPSTPETPAIPSIPTVPATAAPVLESPILPPTPIMFSTLTTPPTPATPATTKIPVIPTVPSDASSVFLESPILPPTPIKFSPSPSITPPTPVTPTNTDTPPIPDTPGATGTPVIPAVPSVASSVFLESPILPPTPIKFSTSPSITPPTPVTPTNTDTPPIPDTPGATGTPLIPAIPPVPSVASSVFLESPILPPTPIKFSTSPSITPPTPVTPANTDTPPIPDTPVATGTPLIPAIPPVPSVASSVFLESPILPPTPIKFSTSPSITPPTPVTPTNTDTPPIPDTPGATGTPVIPAVPSVASSVFLESPILPPTPIKFSTSPSITPPTPVTPANTDTPPIPDTPVATGTPLIPAIPPVPSVASSVFLESPILPPTPIKFSISPSITPPTPVTPTNTDTPPIPGTPATTGTSVIPAIPAVPSVASSVFLDSPILPPTPIKFSTSPSTAPPTPITPTDTDTPTTPDAPATTEAPVISAISAVPCTATSVFLESPILPATPIKCSTSPSTTPLTPFTPTSTDTLLTPDAPATTGTSAFSGVLAVPTTATSVLHESPIPPTPVTPAKTDTPSTPTAPATTETSVIPSVSATEASVFSPTPIKFSVSTKIPVISANTDTPPTPATPGTTETLTISSVPAAAASVFLESPIKFSTSTTLPTPVTPSTPPATSATPTSTPEIAQPSEVFKNETTRGPVRRSQRQINKPEKDNVVKQVLERDKTNSLSNPLQFSHLPEQLEKDENLHATNSQMKNKYPKRELKNTKDISVKKKILLNYETEKQTSSKILKKFKLSEVRVMLEETPILDLNQKLPEKCKLDNVKYSETEKKNDINILNTEVRRKRTHSEPAKNDSIDLSVVKEDVVEKKRLRSLTKQLSPGKKTKKSEKLDTNPRVKKRKRNISAPSDKMQVCKSSENLEIVNKGKRKKHSSLSEEIILMEDNKIEKKESSSESKEPEFKGPSFPCTVIKTKPKKIARRESLRLIVNEDEPPLFSQPDVLVKVKCDEHLYKKEEKPDFDGKPHSQNILSNIKSAPTLVSASAASVEPLEFKSSVINLKQKDVSQEIHTAKNDLKTKEINQNLSIYSIQEQNFFDDFDTKDIDSENSLQIDESIGRDEDSKESDDNAYNQVTESLDDSFSVSSKNKNVETNDSVKQELQENLSESNQPSIDLDSDKPIAERKPRRTIKKKEFFEDITPISEVQTRKSGRQKSNDKKSLDEEDSKLDKNSKQKEEVESDTDESSEDDPEKLWCICRKPHNDRFMIQCDRCEDWFHGSCVGVTRQLGRKLERQKKDWICPNCLSKEPEVSNTVPEKIPEKEVAGDVKRVKTAESKEIKEEKTIPGKSVTSSIKKEKEIEKIVRPPQKSNANIKISSLTPKAMLPSVILNKKIPKIIKSSVKESASPATDRKVTKEIVKKKLNCVACHAPAITNSSYCSDKCIDKHAANCLRVMREVKGSMKASEFDSQKVVVLDCIKGNVIAGDNAPSAGEIVSWLKTNPSYMIACSSNATAGLKKESNVQKRDPDPIVSAKESKEISDEASKTVVRFNVRKTLKNILLDRCKNADDVQLAEEDIRKIAVKIEDELHSLFKDNSFKYRAKYRSLMFNIKDPRNQGLFRKILKGNIPPAKLVRMSPEELASVELAKWREQENQHLLDMIKRVQLEQQSGSCLLKKTHKGEVEIEDDLTDIIEDVPKTTAKVVLPGEPVEVDKSELEKVIVKDTTHLHRSHLFNLNCKICTGKIIPPPVEDFAPKKVRVAYSISVDLSSNEPTEKNVSKDGKSPLSSTGDDSLDQEPTSTVSIGSPEISKSSRKKTLKAAASVWKGFIYMQDVAKFVTSAYKVSGHTEHLHVDVPDTIQVCGRIIPDQVWDYLGKIKQSGNKELIIIRFQAANDEEAVTYNSFYSYLSSRKRYGVVSSYSKKIKDFYILPLAATSPVPMVLMPFNGPGLPSPRPHLLLGVIVRHRGKQPSLPLSKKEKCKDEVEKKDGSYTPPLDNRSYTPPLPVLTIEISSNASPEAVYNPSADLKSMTMPNVSEIIENSAASCSDAENKDPEIYEPSYTPPLQILSADCPKETEDEKPYDPEQDVLIIDSDKKESISSPKENIDSTTSTENLEKHKQILDALTRQVEETDRQVNALKQLISQPDDSDAETHSPGTQPLDINSVTASGMSSFLDLPENLQDILNVVREKSLDKRKSTSEKFDVDMRISELFSKSLDSSGKINIQEKAFSQGATPPPDDNEEASSVTRPSDPRIKLRTNFQEASYTPEEPANFTLKNVSESELVERAKQQLAEMAAFEAIEDVHKPQNASTSQEKLSNLGKISNWHQFKEPPPPGMELTDLAVQDSSYSSKTATTTTASGSSISSSFSQSLIPNPSQIATHFPPPSPFPPHLPPGFSIQTPPPNIKNFPPPNVISTSFPPPPLPLVSKASDVNPVNETWPSWNAPSQDRVPRSESSSHYYTPGSQEFQSEQFYRSETSEGRWSRPPQRFSRNNWNKRPRGARWRGRRPFHFSKIQRN